MRRRRLLKLGAASAVAFALGGVAVSLLHPGLVDGRMTQGARQVVASLARAMLHGSLPVARDASQRQVQELLGRLDSLLASLPAHAQDELSQLLVLLSTSGGRLALAGLREDWSTAGVAEVQNALGSMRRSSVSLRQQAYLALHDLVGAAYFSDPATWGPLGYPGPLAI